MNDLEVREEVTDRVAEAVSHALKLVGPAEGGFEHIGRESAEDRSLR
jgi:hypothetical protein